MHIHGHPINSGTAGVHSAAAAEKAAAAERAAQTRRKLLKGASEIDPTNGEADFGHFMIGRGREEGSGGRHEQSERPPNRSPAGDAESNAKPISVWA